MNNNTNNHNFSLERFITLPFVDAAETAQAYFRSTENLSLANSAEIEHQLKNNLSLLIDRAVRASRLLRSKNEKLFSSSNQQENSSSSSYSTNNPVEHAFAKFYATSTYSTSSNNKNNSDDDGEAARALDCYLRYISYALENNNKDGTLFRLFGADNFHHMKQLKPVFTECLLHTSIPMWFEAKGCAARRSGLNLLHIFADIAAFKDIIAEEYFKCLFHFLTSEVVPLDGLSDDDLSSRRICAQVITAAIRSSKTAKHTAIREHLIDLLAPFLRDAPTGDFFQQVQCFEIIYRVTRVNPGIISRLKLPDIIAASLDPHNSKLNDSENFIVEIMKVLDIHNDSQAKKFFNDNTTTAQTQQQQQLFCPLLSYRVSSYEITVSDTTGSSADSNSNNNKILLSQSTQETNLLISPRLAVLLIPNANGINHSLPLRHIATFRITREQNLIITFKKFDQYSFKNYFGSTDSAIQSESEFKAVQDKILQHPLIIDSEHYQSATAARNCPFVVTMTLSLDPVVGQEMRSGPVQGWVKNALDKKKLLGSYMQNFQQQQKEIQQQQQKTNGSTNNNSNQGSSSSGNTFGAVRDPNSQQQQQAPTTTAGNDKKTTTTNSAAPPSLNNFLFGGYNNNNQMNSNNNNNGNTDFTNRHGSVHLGGGESLARQTRSLSTSSLHNNNNNNTNMLTSAFSSTMKQVLESNKKQQAQDAQKLLRDAVELIERRRGEVKRQEELDIQNYENWYESETKALQTGLQNSAGRITERMQELMSSSSSNGNNNNNNNSNGNVVTLHQINSLGSEIYEDIMKLQQSIQDSSSQVEQQYVEKSNKLKGDIQMALDECMERVRDINAVSCLPEEMVRQLGIDQRNNGDIPTTTD